VTLLAVLILLALPACQAPAQVVETAAPAGDTYPLETPTEKLILLRNQLKYLLVMHKLPLIMPGTSRLSTKKAINF